MALSNQRRAVGFKRGNRWASGRLAAVGSCLRSAEDVRCAALRCAGLPSSLPPPPPPASGMAHKQIYYSDKYFDEHYEYR